MSPDRYIVHLMSDTTSLVPFDPDSMPTQAKYIEVVCHCRKRTVEINGIEMSYEHWIKKMLSIDEAMRSYWREYGVFFDKLGRPEL